MGYALPNHLKSVLVVISLVLLLAVASSAQARTDIRPHHMPFVHEAQANKFAHNRHRGGYIYRGHRHHHRSYSRYYWRTMSYRCHGPRCYKRMCLYKRGIWNPIRCKTRRWWRW